MDAKRRYGIKGGGTIQYWLEQFGMNHLLNKVVRIEMKDEKDRIKELEAEVKRLKMALADKVLTKDILQTVIQLADDHYGADLKKKFGSQRSKVFKSKDFMLDSEWPDNLSAKRAVKQSIQIYNTERPHWSLKLKTPEEAHQAA